MLLKKLTNFKNIPIEAKATIAYAICGILQNCLGFITVPLFARIMTTEQFGQYTVYASWSAILVIFITLNLPYGSFSKAMVKFEDKRDEYIASVEGICILMAMLFLSIYLPFRGFWNNIFDLPTVLVLIMVFEILGNAGILFWSGKNRFQYKYKVVVAVTIFNTLLAPTLAYILITHTEEKGYARIAGYAFVTIAVGGFLYLYNIIKGKKLFCKEFWKYALGFNLPLICYYLSQVVFNQSDRIMIDYFYGKSEAAIYGVAYTLAIVFTFVLNSINNSYVPWFYGKIKAGRKRDNQGISSIIAVLMAILLLAVIWLAPEIILVMAGSEYEYAIWIVPPVAASVLLLFYAQLYINVEFYYEKKKGMIIASIISALLNIVLNWYFIPLVGYVAAGYTTLISYAAFAFMNYKFMKKTLLEENEENDAYNNILLIVIFVVMLGLSALALGLYEQRTIRLIIVGVVLVVVLVNIKKIIQLIKQLLEGKNDEFSGVKNEFIP